MPSKKSSGDKDIHNDHYFQKVFDVTCLIPEGKVSTYGAIADFLALGSAIGTGLFYGSATAIKMAGPSVLLAYIVAGIAIYIIDNNSALTIRAQRPVGHGV